MLKKIIISSLIGISVSGAVLAYIAYNAFFGINTTDKISQHHLSIEPELSIEDLANLLVQDSFIINKKTFLLTARTMKYGSNIRAGKFSLKGKSSNVNIIRHLRTGEQATVNLVINNARTLDDLSGKLAKFVVADSVDFRNQFVLRETQEILETNAENIMTYFIPNTYEVYWSESPKDIIERMKKEHLRFWSTNNRLEKAKSMEMTQEEIYTLASIIEKETNQDSEKPKMAGALLNRLRIGMPLQADPTVVFATGDFTTKRVLNKHLEYDSPYNTYMYRGLPPGPIAMASIASIDAILNADNHKYLYYCAKGDGSGLHNFATNLSSHNRNSRIYAQNLRKRGKR